MPIHLKDGWQDANVLSKIYSSGPRDREVIDHVFNELTDQHKMETAKLPAPFPVQVFVVWKKVQTHKSDSSTSTTIWKGRPVLDMRDINFWTVKDSYPLTSTTRHHHQTPGSSIHHRRRRPELLLSIRRETY